MGQFVGVCVSAGPGLLSGIRYTIRVGAGLKDTNGDALDQSYVSQFTTRACRRTFSLKNGMDFDLNEKGTKSEAG